MNVIWSRWIVSLLTIAAVSAAIGFLAGAVPALSFVIVALLGIIAFGAYHTQLLWRMLDAPQQTEKPGVPGLWGEIYYRLFRLSRRWQSRVGQVEQQHERFIEAIQASPNGVVMLDGEGRIEWCNAISERHFGIDAARDIAQHVTHLVRQPDFVAFLGANRHDDELRMHGVGTRQDVLAVRVVPYGEDHKLLISQDITEIDRTDSMRRDFVANVSHELKTPLTVLSGFLETLRDLPLPAADRKRYLELMGQQSQRMQTIIRDLLVLARLEGDARPPVNVPVNMQALIAQIRQDATSLSGGRHSIDFDVDPALELVGAEGEIGSALGNLVVNAVRYTPDGGTIRVMWRDRDGRGIFSVTDNGIGIPPEHIPRLTERFYRVDRSRSRDTGGTGLGLAIVKHVLQRHDAQLIVRSVEGEGSVFSAIFPLARTLRRVPSLAGGAVHGLPTA